MMQWMNLMRIGKYGRQIVKKLEEGMTECPNCGCPVDDTLGKETDEKPQKVEVTGVKVGIMQCLA